MFLAFQYIISDYGSVIMLNFNESTFINHKSCEEITENGKVLCPTFQMKGRRKEH